MHKSLWISELAESHPEPSIVVPGPWSNQLYLAAEFCTRAVLLLNRKGYFETRGLNVLV